MEAVASREAFMLPRREPASVVRKLVSLADRKLGPPLVLRAVLQKDRKPRGAQRLGLLLGPQRRTLPRLDMATPGMRPLADQRQPRTLPAKKAATKSDRDKQALVTTSAVMLPVASGGADAISSSCPETGTTGTPSERRGPLQFYFFTQTKRQ
jgi:hypothetical protein